jgi:hypothetical protein
MRVSGATAGRPGRVDPRFDTLNTPSTLDSLDLFDTRVDRGGNRRVDDRRRADDDGR